MSAPRGREDRAGATIAAETSAGPRQGIARPESVRLQIDVLRRIVDRLERSLGERFELTAQGRDEVAGCTRHARPA